MTNGVGPAGKPAGTRGGSPQVRCGRCHRPITGKAWRSPVTGRVDCDDCSKGWTYLSGQIHDAARDAGPDRPDDSAPTRAWRKVLRRKG